MDRRRFLVASHFILGGALTAELTTGVAKAACCTAAPTDLLAGPRQGPWRRLFLDAAVVEQQSGLKRIFHAAEKHPDNPLIVADQPWEGKSAITGPYVYGTVLRDEHRFRMWYQLLYEGNHIGYAESLDGIRWQKPPLGLFKFQNDMDTNLVVSAFAPGLTAGVSCHNPSVIERPDDPDPNRRFALYGFDGQSRGPRVGFSPDGLKWSYAQPTPADSPLQPLLSTSDVVNFFYDPYEARYVCTWKTRNRRGRAAGIALSNDGLLWSKPIEGPVFVADDLDPNDTQIYGMPVFPYQGLYIGLPWIYRAKYIRYGQYSVPRLHEAQADSPRNIEAQLSWSWDLVNWTRPPERKPLIGPGSDQAWDRGMVVTARSPVLVNDRLWFYYGGTDKVHDEPRATAGIGLATLRLDGFCSMQCQDPNAEGWFISRPEPMRAPRVLINARTDDGGQITAELIDRKGRVIDGFSRDQCRSFRGDSVRHELTWRDEHFPTENAPRECRIRLILRRAELFSYLPSALDETAPDLARFPSEGP